MSDELFSTLDAVKTLIHAKKYPIYNASVHGEIVSIYVRQCDISNDTGKIHISGPNREEFDEDPAFDDQMGWIDQWIEAEYFYRMNIHNHGNHYHLF